MSDNDLIRREYIGPRLAIAGFGGKALKDAIAALPAVTVGEDVAKAAIDRAIERLRALPNHAGRPAWDAIVAEEIRAALEPVAAPDPAAIREAALREAIEAYPRGVGAILALIQQGAVKEDLE